MIKISNLKIVHIFTKIVILLVVAKAISLGVLFYLPSSGVEVKEQVNYEPKYHRYDFKNMIDKRSVKDEAKSALKSANSIGITNMVLKGLYATSKEGYVIIAMKVTPQKTSIIELFETYQGYTLKAIKHSSAIFEREGKIFVLDLEKTAVSSSNMRLEFSEYDTKKIAREDILFYAKAVENIWRDISIVEVKEGNKIEGFKITKIDKGSKIVSTDLMEGDLIVEINNMSMDSYQNAIDIYNDIANISSLKIVIIRQNQKMELVYEIN